MKYRFLILVLCMCILTGCKGDTERKPQLDNTENTEADDKVQEDKENLENTESSEDETESENLKDLHDTEESFEGKENVDSQDNQSGNSENTNSDANNEQNSDSSYLPPEKVYGILNPELIPTQKPAQGTAEEILANWEKMPVGSVLSTSQVNWNQLSSYFVAYEISDEVFNIINGKSYTENPYVKLEDLRYIKVLHYNFNHELQVGELIVSADLAASFVGIFTELFHAEYEIQSMFLVDYYWTGNPSSTDSASIDYNNTSAFMYRSATSSANLSKHAYGYAIDINPQQNPYVNYSSGSPVWTHRNASDYIDRTTGLPHVITQQDVCYKIFIKYGFMWGGNWDNPKDYQHFYM